MLSYTFYLLGGFFLSVSYLFLGWIYCFETSGPVDHPSPFAVHPCPTHRRPVTRVLRSLDVFPSLRAHWASPTPRLPSLPLSIHLPPRLPTLGHQPYPISHIPTSALLPLFVLVSFFFNKISYLWVVIDWDLLVVVLEVLGRGSRWSKTFRLIRAMLTCFLLKWLNKLYLILDLYK